MVQVCKRFFLKTLNIGEAIGAQALSKKKSGHFHGKDERGRHTPQNKTSEEKLARVRKHTESFPAVDPHYIRDFKAKVLSSGFEYNKNV